MSGLCLQSSRFGVRISNFFFGHFFQNFAQYFARLIDVSNNERPDVEIMLTGFFGIASKTTTPPSNLLCLETRVSINLATSSPDTFCQSFSTIYPLGNSSPLIVTPTTPASAIAGCSSNTASNSAGATCNPLTLINSFLLSTIK